MTHDDDREVLTALLDASGPPVPRPTMAEQTALARMAVAAPSGGMLARARRLPRRLVAGLAAGFVVLGSGTVAVGAASGIWEERFQDPDLLYSFTLPSGARCEMRLNGGRDGVDKDQPHR